MKKNKFNNFSLKYQSWLVFLAYFLIFLVVFIRTRHGVALFWDWNWPIWRDSMPTIFDGVKNSWSDSNLGQPLSYASSFYLRLIWSVLGYLPLQPETILYLMIAAISAISANGLYLIAKRKLNSGTAFLIGLIAVANPAYLYKLLAGHLTYLVSYAIFIYLINFLYNKYQKGLYPALVLGLLLAFVGFQIQFFIFAFATILIFSIFHYKKISVWWLLVSFFIAMAINLPWLSNFLFGVNTVVQVSGEAGNLAFTSASQTSIWRIMSMVFSDATDIKYLYPKYMFAYFGLFSLVLLIASGVRIYKKKVPAEIWSLLVTLTIFIFIGTGVYQNWHIPVLELLYPMLRESGHMALPIILFMVLLLIKFWSKKLWIRWPLTSYFLVFTAINFAMIYQKLPLADFSLLRSYLTPYKEYLAKDNTPYRVASYPFFGQYAAKGVGSKTERGRLLSNSGIDPFNESSGYETLSNYILAQTLNKSLQFQLVSDYSLKKFEDRNIKYLLDFSAFYESNMEKYCDASVYNNNLALIKNDKDFFQKLVQKNPDRISQVAPGIYQLSQSRPRISANNGEVSFTKISPVEYEVELKNVTKDYTEINLLVDNHSGWRLYSSDTETELSSQAHKAYNDYGKVWLLSFTEAREKLDESEYQINKDGSYNIKIKIKFWPQKLHQISVIASLIIILTALIIIAFSARSVVPKHKLL